MKTLLLLALTAVITSSGLLVLTAATTDTIPAAILFLRNDSLQFREIGDLGSQPESAVDDQCRASCVDSYGNARPLFLRAKECSRCSGMKSSRAGLMMDACVRCGV